MSAALVVVLVFAVLLAFRSLGGPNWRLRQRLNGPPMEAAAGRGSLRPPRMMRRGLTFTPMAVLVQQSAALLRGGRAPARLWDELWLLHGGQPSPGRALSDAPQSLLAPLSRACLVAARAAAGCGAPVGAAIRAVATSAPAGAGAGAQSNAATGERGAWVEFAACFDIAEASGSPLADVLARFAAQLEAEDDAEAARQTAFAGPRATVRLLSWLPILGLGLGMVLGVDPISILLGEPAGLAALVAGGSLTAAGRIWSAKLVRSAARQPK